MTQVVFLLDFARYLDSLTFYKTKANEKISNQDIIVVYLNETAENPQATVQTFGVSGENLF